MPLPSTLVRADFATWSEEITLPSWAGENAAIRYVFTRNGFDPVEKEADLSGTTSTLELSAAESSQLDAGEWRLVRIIEDDGKRESCTAVPRVIVRPDPLEGDAQSFNSRMVAALQASIEGRSSALLESHTINGQSVSKMPISEQQKLLERYEQRLRREQDAERVSMGGASRRTVYPDFR